MLEHSEMAWDTGLLPSQRIAASHIGSHARLLAGPGTGKTLTLSRRIVYLIKEKRIHPHYILALTFTRAAAHELRERVAQDLGTDAASLPRVATLHSFSLRQLLKNAARVETLPRPLRIADDWEERQIILEDLRDILEVKKIKQVKDKLNELSANWETLTAEGENWEKNYPDPKFLGAWRQHRDTYGYTLRSELVYQLKKAIERDTEFTLEQNFKYILVDEFQDLNLCDLAVVRDVSSQGAEVFGAGDDDQSIYGFRFAYPDGIREFGTYYTPFTPLELELCKRCDKKILRLGLFVAELDTKRKPKRLEPMPEAGEGEVHILQFNDQKQEANGIAQICRHLIQNQGVRPADILLLLRADTNGAFSTPLRQALEKQTLPVASRTEYVSPLDTREGRQLLAILHLAVNRRDHLAWRTLFKLRNNSIGEVRLKSIYDFAVQKGMTFCDVVEFVANNPDSFPELTSLLPPERKAILELVDTCDQTLELPVLVSAVAEKVIENAGDRQVALDYLNNIVDSAGVKSLPDLLSALSTSLEDREPEVASDKINILTMHKAKGLTADAVFIVAAEDEYLPGNQKGEEKVGDERRLLYVSMTRAKHFLFLTQCVRRTGQQQYTGRGGGMPSRHLTRFLLDAPIKLEDGNKYFRSLAT